MLCILSSYSCSCLVAESCLSLVTLWSVARQAPLSMGFSRQEYWSGLPLPSAGDLPDTGIKPTSSALQANFSLLSHRGSPKLIVLYQLYLSKTRTFRKLRLWHLVPSLHGKQMGKQWKQCQTLFWGAPKSLQMVTAAMKLKDAYSLEGKL